MLDYTKKLKEETDRRIRQIESSRDNTIDRALAASVVLEEAFCRLKEFIAGYQFRDETQEILFFKEIKPRMFCRLIYYRKVYNIGMNRPVCSMDAQKEYLHKELDALQDYIYKRLDFYRYYRSGATHLDRLYYLRNATRDAEQYVDSFYFERDPLFSTGGDFKVAKIMANDLLQEYLSAELESLSDTQSYQSLFPKCRLSWKGTKAELNEQLFAWDSKGSFGDVPLTQLSNYIQNVFNIELDHNLSRTLGDMRIRNKPTPFLDSLKEALLKRMKRSK